MLSIYDRDIEGNGVLTYHAVRYSYLGVILSHLFLILSCYVRKQYIPLTINVVCLIFTLYLYFLFKKTPLQFDNIVSMCKDLKITEPKQQDVESWITHYTHPIMKMTKYFYAYKKNFESPNMRGEDKKIKVRDSMHQSRIATEGNEEEVDEIEPPMEESLDSKMDIKEPNFQNNLGFNLANIQATAQLQQSYELQELGRRLAGDSLSSFSEIRQKKSSRKNRSKFNRKKSANTFNSKTSKSSRIIKLTPTNSKNIDGNDFKPDTFSFKEDEIKNQKSDYSNFDEDNIRFHFYSPTESKGINRKPGIEMDHLSMSNREVEKLFGMNNTLGVASPGMVSDKNTVMNPEDIQFDMNSLRKKSEFSLHNNNKSEHHRKSSHSQNLDSSHYSHKESNQMKGQKLFQKKKHISKDKPFIDNMSLNLSSSCAPEKEEIIQNMSSSKEQLNNDSFANTPFSTLEDLNKINSKRNKSTHLTSGSEKSIPLKERVKKKSSKKKKKKKKQNEQFDFFSDSFGVFKASDKFKKDQKNDKLE